MTEWRNNMIVIYICDSLSSKNLFIERYKKRNLSAWQWLFFFKRKNRKFYPKDTFTSPEFSISKPWLRYVCISTWHRWSMCVREDIQSEVHRYSTSTCILSPFWVAKDFCLAWDIRPWYVVNTELAIVEQQILAAIINMLNTSRVLDSSCRS